MRTAGLMMNDVWADRVLREQGVQAYRYDETEAEIGVHVESVEIKHRSQEEKYRPYLHLSGELRSITPSQALTFDISQVTYSPGQGERVDAFYEFSDEQLVQLAAKGYFSKDFRVPESITDLEWQLPAKVDLLVLAPSDREGDVPVVFSRVHDIGGLETSEYDSGYDLSLYFEDYSREGVTEPDASVDTRLRVRTDEVESLFTEEELDLQAQSAQSIFAATDKEGEAELDGLALQLREVEEEVSSEAEQLRAQLESTEGTTQNIYLERVARVLQQQPDPTEAQREVRAEQAEAEAEEEERKSKKTEGYLDMGFPDTPAAPDRPKRAVPTSDYDGDTSTYAAEEDLDQGLGS